MESGFRIGFFSVSDYAVTRKRSMGDALDNLLRHVAPGAVIGRILVKSFWQGRPTAVFRMASKTPAAVVSRAFL
jgi:hypothetical protein